MYTQSQINQIKSIQTWNRTSFHGNTKKVGTLPIEEYLTIIAKKKERELRKVSESRPQPAQLVRQLLRQNAPAVGTPYHKVMIEGNTGIYLASPIHQHSDYNKCRVFAKTDKGLKLMAIYNQLIGKIG